MEEALRWPSCDLEAHGKDPSDQRAARQAVLSLPSTARCSRSLPSAWRASPGVQERPWPVQECSMWWPRRACVGGGGRIPPGPARRTTACEHEAARASPSSLLRRPAPSHSRATRLCRSRALTQRWHVLSVRGHWRLLTWRRQVTCWASCRPSQPGCVDFRAAAGPTGRAVAAGLGGRVPAQPHQSAFPKRKRHKAQDGQCQLPCPREPTWSGNPQSEQEERCG